MTQSSANGIQVGEAKTKGDIRSLAPLHNTSRFHRRSRKEPPRSASQRRCSTLIGESGTLHHPDRRAGDAAPARSASQGRLYRLISEPKTVVIPCQESPFWRLAESSHTELLQLILERPFAGGAPFDGNFTRDHIAGVV